MNPEIKDTLWETVLFHAETIPDVGAILAPNRVPLRFGELPACLTAIRDTLNGCGVGRGDIVAAVLPNGPETALCLLGVAACAVYSALDPSLTEAEITRYLKRVKPKAMILPGGTFDHARRAAHRLGIRVLDLLANTDQPAGSLTLHATGSGTCEKSGWGSEADIALLIATSGTTGSFKLVPRKQRHMMAQTRSSKMRFRFTPEDVGLHMMPMFHGHGMEQALTVPLLAGSGVVCPSAFTVQSFFDHLASFEPTWYSAGFSHHTVILDALERHPKTVGKGNLRFVRSGSGRLDPKTQARLEAALDVPVIEGLGMSEVPNAACNPLPPVVRKPGTVGTAFGVDIGIMDGDNNLLPPNREGEIVARGPTVFEGYFDDPVTTKAVLVDGWFHTGDLGRLDADGYLTVIGRLTDIINRGGEKIHPREIEDALHAHPAIKEAAAFAIPHPTLGQIVGAAIVPVAGKHPAKQDLMGHLFGILAPFKVPRGFLKLDALPKGRTGKIDRDALAAMHDKRANAA